MHTSEGVRQRRHPNNWGRWGDRDEIGCLNLLDQEQVLRGASAIRHGKVFTLGNRFCRVEGDVHAPGRASSMRFMVMDKSYFVAGKQEPWANGGEWADDAMITYTHGSTHVDALGHFWRGDEIYNGKSALSTTGGMEVNSVLPIAERGIAGHGVLLDVARYKGVSHLVAGEAITLDDLLKTAEQQGVKLQKRDILLVRTGWLGHIERLDESQLAEFQSHFAEPGLRHSEELVNWFYDMEIPLLASDNLTNECWKNDQDPKMLELHVTLMSNLGVLFSEINTLDPLAADCEQDRQYDFLYAAGPLKIVGATGAPMNPLAIK